jgi:hypothetical protein
LAPMGAHNVFAVRHGVQATQIRGFEPVES